MAKILDLNFVKNQLSLIPNQYFYVMKKNYLYLGALLLIVFLFNACQQKRQTHWVNFVINPKSSIDLLCYVDDGSLADSLDQKVSNGKYIFYSLEDQNRSSHDLFGIADLNLKPIFGPCYVKIYAITDPARQTDYYLVQRGSGNDWRVLDRNLKQIREYTYPDFLKARDLCLKNPTLKKAPDQSYNVVYYVTISNFEQKIP